MLEQFDQVLDELTAKLSNLNQTLTEQVRRPLDVMDYDVPYNSISLMEKLGMKSRESFRSNYLQPAIHLGLVQMIIPEKPNSQIQQKMPRKFFPFSVVSTVFAVLLAAPTPTAKVTSPKIS